MLKHIDIRLWCLKLDVELLWRIIMENNWWVTKYISTYAGKFMLLYLLFTAFGPSNSAAEMTLVIKSVMDCLSWYTLTHNGQSIDTHWWLYSLKNWNILVRWELSSFIEIQWFACSLAISSSASLLLAFSYMFYDIGSPW